MTYNPIYVPGPGDEITWPYDPADYDADIEEPDDEPIGGDS